MHRHDPSCRVAAFVAAAGIAPGIAEGARASVEAHLDLPSPEEDERVLREAGL